MTKKRKIIICASVFYVCLYLLFSLGTAYAATTTPTPTPTPAKTPAPGTTTAPTAPGTTGTAPTEGLKLKLQQPFSGLAEEMQISGTSIGEYIKALYTFGSSAIVALAIVMIIVGGVRWILSAGNPEAIGKAKDTIMKSLLGLFIALFAIFMLQTLSPGTVTFKSITPEGIQGLNCCQVGSDFSQITPDECRSKGGTVVGFEKCMGTETTTPAPTSACGALLTCPTCEANTSCQWQLQTGAIGCTDTSLGQCALKPSTGLTTLHQDLVCSQQSTRNACYSNAKSGCIWSSKFCRLAPTADVSTLSSNPCSMATSKDTCANTNCQWVADSGGCTLQITLATQFGELADCAKRVKDNCVTNYCYWQSWISGTSGCFAAISGQCYHYEECGDQNYCYIPNTKQVKTNGVPTNDSPGTCQPKLTIGSACEVCGCDWIGIGLGYCNPINCDQACISNNCPTGATCQW